ncbi:MAG: alkaline phosphatase family protein, partial [Armatimonadetes bacterium]|nr:alkaline phosphatase family protein [Armatimonadota bacterium]
MRRLFCSFALLLAAPVIFAQGSRLVIISWDGAADWVVDRLLQERRLPNVEKMRAEGVHAEGVIMAPPTKTAVGHSLIWTGAYPDQSGVTGNAVPLLPRSRHTVLETQSGFSSAALSVEPIWLTALLQGKSVAVLSATHSFPPDPFLATIAKSRKEDEDAGHTYRADPSRFHSFSGFEKRLASPTVYTEDAELKEAERFSRTGKEFQFTIRDRQFAAFFPRDDEGSFRECIIFRLDGDQASFATYMRMPLTDFGAPIEIRDGDDWGLLSFTLLDLAPDLSHFMLYQGACSAFSGHFGPARGQAYVYATGGFHDLPISDLYANGKLGKTYWMGGDGKAEDRLLRLIQRDFERLGAGFRHAIDFFEPHLVIHYTPALDSLGHLLMGVLDPNSPKYSAQLAGKLWPVYAKAYEYADRWLGDVMTAAGPQAIVALVSDHGMEGVGRRVSVNRILMDAGLAGEGTDGLDLSQTQVLAAPWNEFCVVVNTAGWKEGVVPLNQKNE